MVCCSWQGNPRFDASDLRALFAVLCQGRVMAWHTLPLDEWSKFRELTDADPCLLLQILADAVRPVTLSS
jgi:hypothetical protein